MSSTRQLSLGSTISRGAGAAARTAAIWAEASSRFTLIFSSGTCATVVAMAAIAWGVSMPIVIADGSAETGATLASAATSVRPIRASRSHRAQSTALRAAPGGIA